MALTKVTGDFIKAGSITQGHLHSSHGITTTHIAEGDKLFFTNARVDSRVGSLSTSNLSEGTNLYYTDARVDARIAAASTSDLSEGTNLYYTDARADARVALIVDSAPGTLNTLNELAAALGDDANFSTTVTNSIALKAPLASPSFTGNATFAGGISVSSPGSSFYTTFKSANDYVIGLKDSANTAQWWLKAYTNGSFALHEDSVGDKFTIAAGGNVTFTGTLTASGYNDSNWNTAYGWGNHASAGYLTSFDITTQTDGKYLRSNTADEATHRIVFSGCDTNNHDTIATSTGSLGAIEIYNNGVSKDAFMTFHVGSDFACYFGLDGGTNKLSVGGWSMGAASYEIYHAGNLPSLATLGYTGATNANYITNNNQLTNGAGYITSYTETDTLATVTGRGASTSSVVTLTGGSKIVVQGATDGGGSRGIFMWTNTDSNWGIYMSTPGSTNNIGGGTAPSGLNGETSHSIRFRIASNASNGFIWENHNNAALMSLRGSAGDLITSSSMRSPIFYDSNNTAYYLNPQDQSSMYGVAVRGDNANTGTGNQIFFWGSGNSTTSAIGFKANGGNFTNPTGNGDGYNTYLTMDTAGRGWVFRQGTGGSNFTSLNNSGWILNNGIWQANASMRSPVFYDSNDTGYYMNYLGGGTLRGNFQFAANSTSTSYNDASIELRESNYTSNGTATPPFIGFHWGGVVASSIAIESNGRIAIRNNPGNAYEKFIASVMYASSDVQSPIYYDSNDTAYYTDPASTSSLKLLKTGQNHQSNAPRWDTSFYVAQSQHYYAHSSTQTMYLGESNTIEIRSVGIASGSLRAPLFYDSNNTTYYADPGSTSNMNAVTLVGTFSGQNGYFNQDLAVGFNSGAIGGKLNIQINSNNGIGVKNNLNGRSGVTGLLQYTSASYASSGYNMVFQAAPPSGSDTNMLLCYINGNIVNRFNSYGQYSDIKLKENIVDTTPKLEDVKRIRIRNFNFKGDPYKQIGVVAQEFEEVFPGLVEDKEVPDEEGTTKTVKYSVLVPILVKAMQEQQAIIDDLKSRLETLENQ